MSKNNLYLVGRGNVNLKNNGHYSDFFWAINSDFDLSRIYYGINKKSVVKNLADYDIKFVDGFHVQSNKTEFQTTKPTLVKKNRSAEEREIFNLLKRYNNEVRLYQQFFYENNITPVGLISYRLKK